jgi:hypothetical protein
LGARTRKNGALDTVVATAATSKRFGRIPARRTSSKSHPSRDIFAADLEQGAREFLRSSGPSCYHPRASASFGVIVHELAVFR